MRLYDLKEYLHDLVSRYFQQATVIWANEVSTKPSLPLVMLRLGMVMGFVGRFWEHLPK